MKKNKNTLDALNALETIGYVSIQGEEKCKSSGSSGTYEFDIEEGDYPIIKINRKSVTILKIEFHSWNHQYRLSTVRIDLHRIVEINPDKGIYVPEDRSQSYYKLKEINQ